MFGLLRLLLLGLLIAMTLAVIAIVRQLRNPPRRTYASALRRNQPGDPSELPPPLGPRAFRAFTFAAPRSTRSAGTIQLPAWDIAADDPLGPVVLCTPGWGDSKLGVLARLAPLLPHASRVIAWDPAGMGESPADSRCNLGTDADVLALCALAHACASPHTSPPAPLLLLGWSLGAGVSIVAASRLAQEGNAPIAVIAEAPYRLGRTPVINYLRAIGLPYRIVEPIAAACLGLTLRGTLDWSTFDRARHAAGLPCPLLVIHGTLDAICPHEDGQRIAAAAPRSLFISIEGAGHNDLWSIRKFTDQCAAAIQDFIRAVRPSSTTHARNPA
ncbi:MAG: alpha/beta hydrolase [Phycisphaerae bacterium]|nr:alpha/beta hydrolase [Phycisphaerae bacterium]